MRTLGRQGATMGDRKSSAAAMTKGRRMCGVGPMALETVNGPYKCRLCDLHVTSRPSGFDSTATGFTSNGI